jgi:hypothetical protein
MQLITKLDRPIPNPLLNMATGKNHQAKKEKSFKDRKVDKTDHEVIKKNKIQENMLTAMPVDGYVPLYKKLNELVPIDRNRYR